MYEEEEAAALRAAGNETINNMPETKTLTLKDFMSFVKKVEEGNPAISINEIENVILDYKGRCIDCKRRFNTGQIKYYQHNDGFTILEAHLRVWLYFHCPCGYETPLRKIINGIIVMHQFKRDCPSWFHISMSHVKILDYKYCDETGQAIDYEEQWFVPVADKHYYTKLGVLPLVERECIYCGEPEQGKYALTSQLFGEE